MKNFEYIKPSTVTLASELLKGEHTAACAGGTDLIDLMRNTQNGWSALRE